MVIASVLAAVFAVGCLLLCYKAGIFEKILVKFGIRKKQTTMNWTAFSWESCLTKMNCQADIVFFGDSLSRGGDFHLHCGDRRLVNLGCSGDTLAGMIGRVSTVQMLSPEKVFVMGGINGLTNYNVAQSVSTYEDLLHSLEKALPTTEIYIQGLLPLSSQKAKRLLCNNKTIQEFNLQIKEMAKKRGHMYIDLYSLYEKNGEMDPDITLEGLHIKPEGYDRWYDALSPYLN